MSGDIGLTAGRQGETDVSETREKTTDGGRSTGQEPPAAFTLHSTGQEPPAAFALQLRGGLNAGRKGAARAVMERC